MRSCIDRRSCSKCFPSEGNLCKGCSEGSRKKRGKKEIIRSLESNVCKISQGPTEITVCDNEVAKLTASNGLMVLEGNTGTSNLIQEGSGKRMFYFPPKGAFRTGSAVEDSWNLSKLGDFSYAEGYGCEASGKRAHAEGYRTIASGVDSHSEGSHTIAEGDDSSSHGIFTKASHKGVFLIGCYGSSINATESSSNPVLKISPDYSFQIAGGLSPNSQGVSVMIGTETFGSVPRGGGISSFWAVGGPDYAEYFEWNDGNPQGIDRHGYFVSLQKEKIVISPGTEEVLGITSDISGIIGDAAELGWKGAYETDILLRHQKRYTYFSAIENLLHDHEDFLREIREHDYPDDSHLPIAVSELKNCPVDLIEKIRSITPISTCIYRKDYDPLRTYIPRSQRKEWIKVGMMGKIPVYDDGTCIEGERCDCKNGIATKGSTWYVMKRISPYTVMVLFR